MQTIPQRSSDQEKAWCTRMLGLTLSITLVSTLVSSVRTARSILAFNTGSWSSALKAAKYTGLPAWITCGRPRCDLTVISSAFCNTQC